MPSRFKHLLPIPHDTLEHMWREALLVLDTNILLHIYRLDPAGRDELMNTLEHPAVQERLFIPYHVANEFFQNRPNVIISQHDDVAKLKTKLSEGFDGLEGAFERIHKYHPFVQSEEWSKKINSAKQELLEELNDSLEAYPRTALKDPLLDRVKDILTGRVGEPFDDERLRKLKEEGKDRIEAEKPPGFRDGNKSADKSVGDYLIWSELLQEAARRKTDAIFVSDDAKDDWLQVVRNQRLGARTELRQEFSQRVEGSHFHIVDYENFLLHADQLMGSSRSEDERRALTERARILNTILRQDSEAKGVKELVRVECPECPKECDVALGIEAGESAIATCDSCSCRFHIHRDSDGKVFTRRWGSSGGAKKPLEFDCPNCKSFTFSVRSPRGDGTWKPRYCLKCYAKIQPSRDEPYVLESPRRPILADEVGKVGPMDRSLLRCSECGSNAIAFTEYDYYVWAECDECDRLMKADEWT